MGSCSGCTRRVRPELYFAAMRLLPVLLFSIAAPARADSVADARALLGELIAIDTSNPPGGEEKAARAVAARLKRENLPSEVVVFAPGRASVVARLKGDGSRRPLIL